MMSIDEDEDCNTVPSVPSCAIRFVPEEVRKTLVDALRVDISNRPQKILINWVETLSSPLKEDAVDARVVRVATPTRALQAPQTQTLTVNKIDNAVLYNFATADTGTQGHIEQGSLCLIKNQNSLFPRCHDHDTMSIPHTRCEQAFVVSCCSERRLFPVEVTPHAQHRRDAVKIQKLPLILRHPVYGVLPQSAYFSTS